MTASLNPPSIGWLYLSDDDIQQAERLLDSLKEEDAADSLGLRPLADLFAKWFYPALTKPMTHARYPSRANAAAVRETAKRLQLGLVAPLGVVKGQYRPTMVRNLERWPATIYWNFLRALGIFTQPISEQRYYGAIVQRFKELWDSEDGVRQAEGVHIGR